MVLAVSPSIQARETDPREETASQVVALTAEQRRQAGIEVASVVPRALEWTLRVPGEVIDNAYASAKITPRITAQVVARHARLGEQVQPGQPLVTLSSVAMAQAQGELIVAHREWQRVKSLGRRAVSERRYTQAQVAQQQALAKVRAYGMTEVQANALMQSGDASKAIGTFDLLAPRSGTVLSDDFIVGELIEPGRVLLDISDESVLWVEAQMAPDALPNVVAHSTARVSIDGTRWIEGKLIQRHHRLNTTTRTQGLRIAIANDGDRFHSGQFVQVEIKTGSSTKVLAVPGAAVTMIAGENTVFKLDADNAFSPRTIAAGATFGDWIVISGGLDEGDQIAVTGVFHLKSLLLKSQIGDSD